MEGGFRDLTKCLKGKLAIRHQNWAAKCIFTGPYKYGIPYYYGLEYMIHPE